MLAVMKMLKKSLFTIILLVGCSLVAFGQSNDKKNPPPKSGDKPVVPVEPKKNPPPTPKPTPTPKKPNSQLIDIGAVGQVLIG